MIEVAFYDTAPPGEEDELVGSIRLETVDGAEQVTFHGPDLRSLHVIAEGVPVPAEVTPGAYGRALLANAPAYWLRNIHTEFRHGYSYVKLLADDGAEPDDLSGIDR